MMRSPPKYASARNLNDIVRVWKVSTGVYDWHEPTALSADNPVYNLLPVGFSFGVCYPPCLACSLPALRKSERRARPV